MSEPSKEERIQDFFFIEGTQYYVVATQAAHEFLSPVCATLYHHSIERLLKGALATKMKLKELKKVNHDLSMLWNRFCQEYDYSPGHHQFTVFSLNEFENIRYVATSIESGQEFRVNISLGGNGPILSDAFPSDSPTYHLNVEHLDELVKAIFEVSGTPIQPYSNAFRGVFRKHIPPGWVFNTEM
ncbi:MAG: hypothetical protein HYZ26_01615 [Chloroflexi bacterium]|nr:hypothetical protein [Chloroflexota bacterium]